MYIYIYIYIYVYIYIYIYIYMCVCVCVCACVRIYMKCTKHEIAAYFVFPSQVSCQKFTRQMV